MLGGAGLKGRGAMPAIARQRLTAFSRSSRSMSSFRSYAPGFPVRYGRLNQSLAGNLSWRPASSIPHASAARFNSTAATATASASTATAATAVDTAAPEQAADLSDFDITAIPEKIGYLKDLGLDYGWGPSSMIEYFIEHFHIWAGLHADVSTKIHNLKDVVAPLRAKMAQAANEKRHADMMQTRAELQQLHSDHGVKFYKTMIPFIQLPLGFGCYRVVKGMTSLPVPGLAVESVGWIKDLTVADPYFLLPAATAFAMYLSFKKGGENGMNQMANSPVGRAVLYGMPALSFAFMSFFPSALQLYFLSTGLFALGQAYMLSSNSFRQFANIAIPKKPAEATGMSPEEHGRAIRMILDTQEADKKMEVPTVEVGQAQNLSFVDRTLNSVKKNYDNLTTDVKGKLDSAMGNEPKKNADGSLAEPPRLSEKDRKLAADYEQRRKEEEDWKREERNHARREAHLRALELEREKARSAFKNSKQR
ncbi:mitochondrial export translocase Oxa1 [Aspergillus bombycis]|uniref:Mitochondrial export translocase Oxa1 n=1 Tax=Aspergillus bombycis TaxID=109264 RepID=A0A1F7ZMK6_9EURO|nr:mitochondrial export translocase Oxa1 [Aspergillus bombycis]OGM40539.1 mitochondrial export translocase Oxa1 [Aspergillus bombycis]